jgi:hypothetical protein
MSWPGKNVGAGTFFQGNASQARFLPALNFMVSPETRASDRLSCQKRWYR